MGHILLSLTLLETCNLVIHVHVSDNSPTSILTQACLNELFTAINYPNSYENRSGFTKCAPYIVPLEDVCKLVLSFLK